MNPGAGRVLVAGVDSSTQSCKVVIRDAGTGELVRQGRAPHPPGTEVHPDAWWDALMAAAADAGGIDDVAAVAVAGQQHGLVCLDESGEVVRPALLWNDTRSAGAAQDLVAELGAEAWAEAVGSVPVASFTVTKLRWLAEHEPALAERVAAVCLPHDWLTWKLRATGELAELSTDRGDASGTGYWSPRTGTYRTDLLERAFGRVPILPRVAGPDEVVGMTASGALLAPGTGDNMAAVLGVGASLGDVIVSVGTSGVVSAPAAQPAGDPEGSVAGFADATGAFLPLACTLNAAGVLDAVAGLLGCTLEDLSAMALRAPAGADGLVLVPYLAGERTPNLPSATGALHGLTHANASAAHLARAAVEGVLCSLRHAQDALGAHGVVPERVVLVGGGARSDAVRRLAPAILGVPVHVLDPGEYVADGAARQAAWVLAPGGEPPAWTPPSGTLVRAEAAEEVVRRYDAASRLVLERVGDARGTMGSLDPGGT